MDLRVAGVEFDRLLQMNDRLVVLTALQQSTAEGRAGKRVVPRYSQRMSEKSDAVAPIADLEECQAGIGTDDAGPRHRQNPVADTRERIRRWDEPRQGHVQAQRRKVHIAVGHLLPADLHKPDQGHERAQIPQPADQNKRSALCACERENGDRRAKAENPATTASRLRSRPGWG